MAAKPPAKKPAAGTASPASSPAAAGAKKPAAAAGAATSPKAASTTGAASSAGIKKSDSKASVKENRAASPTRGKDGAAAAAAPKSPAKAGDTKKPAAAAAGAAGAKKPAAAGAAGAKKPAAGAPAKTSPEITFDGRAHQVTKLKGKKDLKVVIGGLAESVLISECSEVLVQVFGKCSQITVESSDNVGVVWDDVVGSVEGINSQKLQFQCNKTVGTLNIENVTDCAVYLPKEMKASVQVVTSKSTGVNLSIQDEDGEYHVPQQLITKYVEGKPVTEART